MNVKVRYAGLCCILALVASAGYPQVIPEPELGDRLVNLPSHLVLPADTLELLFTHRFSQTISDAGAGNLGGLDSAADVGIGLGLGFGHGLDAQIYRSAFLKEYEAAVKWSAVRQGSSFPLGLAVRLGADYRSATGTTDRWAGFGQLIVAWRAGKALDLFAIPTYVSDTPTLRHAFNSGIAASFHLPHGWDIVTEGIPPNRDVDGSNWAWAVGFNKRIRGHAFLIYLGNSRATMTDLMAGSDIPGGFKSSDVRLGFNLIRRFPE